MTHQPHRAVRAVLAVVVVLVALVLHGCSGGNENQVSGASPETGYAAIIDVRTPAEFAEGHVADAVNIDLQSVDFESKVRALEPSGTYLVYCRSGNRSATAADIMEAVGLAVVDGGGLEDMQSAGFVLAP